MYYQILMNSNNISIYSSEDFAGMRKAGALASYILDKLQDIIEPGISTEKINEFFSIKLL